MLGIQWTAASTLFNKETAESGTERSSSITAGADEEPHSWELQQGRSLYLRPFVAGERARRVYVDPPRSLIELWQMVLKFATIDEQKLVFGDLQKCALELFV